MTLLMRCFSVGEWTRAKLLTPASLTCLFQSEHIGRVQVDEDDCQRDHRQQRKRSARQTRLRQARQGRRDHSTQSVSHTTPRVVKELSSNTVFIGNLYCLHRERNKSELSLEFVRLSILDPSLWMFYRHLRVKFASGTNTKPTVDRIYHLGKKNRSPCS